VTGVLFDFGSTLFAHAGLAETIATAAAGLGHQLDVAAAVRLAAAVDGAAMLPAEIALGRDLDAGVWSTRWTALYGALDIAMPGLGAVVDASMHDPRAWPPYASTAEVLGELRAGGVPVGVVSNTGWDVRAVFAHHRLDHLVDAFVLSYEVGRTKPDPAIFELAAMRLGVPAGEVLMVGDDPVSDGGAVRAGLRTLLLPPAAPGADNGLSAVIALAVPSARSLGTPR
jgi:HAD superfamily hydrolase (TIGR01493 family)